MDAFLENAERMLQTAWDARESGELDCFITVNYRGGIQMVSGAGWSLAALAAEHGARAAYRVSRRGRSLRVEGWAAGRTCVLEREWLGHEVGRAGGQFGEGALAASLEFVVADPDDRTALVHGYYRAAHDQLQAA